MGQKMKFFNFELEEKLDRHSDVEFDGESDGDGPEAQKTLFGAPKWPLLTPLWAKNLKI